MKLKIAVVLTLLAAGRAMTLAFVARVGDGGPGDPPDAWLMPLVGDAIIGLAAIVVAALLWFRPTAPVWLIAVVWSAIGAFDALAALLVELSVPWPEFFMLELLGRSMFVGAIALHVVIIGLLTRPEVMARFGIGPGGGAVAA